MSSPQRDAEVAIIGLGVIGGSAALRLRERGTPTRGFSASAADRELARKSGIAVTETLDQAVKDVGLVLIAVPIDRICAVATQVIGAAPPSATILHAGSLQRLEAVHELPEVGARVIGTHPLAGSHLTGFGGARADLFSGATIFVERRASPRQREDAELFWSMAGAKRVEYTSANEHDAAMAWVSHLPQLASTALASTLADKTSLAIPLVPGPGARDATRLAMSTLEIWQPILDRAPAETTSALRALETHLQQLRIALESRDWESVRGIWSAAHDWREAAEHREGQGG